MSPRLSTCSHAPRSVVRLLRTQLGVFRERAQTGFRILTHHSALCLALLLSATSSSCATHRAGIEVELMLAWRNVPRDTEARLWIEEIELLPCPMLVDASEAKPLWSGLWAWFAPTVARAHDSAFGLHTGPHELPIRNGESLLDILEPTPDEYCDVRVLLGGEGHDALTPPTSAEPEAKDSPFDLTRARVLRLHDEAGRPIDLQLEDRGVATVAIELDGASLGRLNDGDSIERLRVLSEVAVSMEAVLIPNE